jgi:hypothetical protein
LGKIIFHIAYGKRKKALRSQLLTSAKLRLQKNEVKIYFVLQDVVLSPGGGCYNENRFNQPSRIDQLRFLAALS